MAGKKTKPATYEAAWAPEAPEGDVWTPRPWVHPAQREEEGRAARKRVPRVSHAAFELRPERDPIAILEAQEADRLPELVPLRHARMAESPFAYRAMAETQPKLSLLLFLSFLGLVGFPISPAFLGEDLLLSHASSHAPWFALPITIAFVINGIAAARVFQRLCMGRPTELSAVQEDIGAEAQHYAETSTPKTV